MKRRSLLLLGAFTPLALFTSRFLGARSTNPRSPSDYSQLAIQLNDLASNIHTQADARRLIDFVANLFSGEIPSRFIDSSLCNQFAHAEFLAVSNPLQAIPEQRLADAWNAYVLTLHAPQDQQVTSVEIHNLRDAVLATSRVFWSHGQRNIWAVPSLCATLPNGQLAPGSRAIESVRILWSLASQPGTLKGARDRVSKGLLLSDELRQPRKSTTPSVAHVRVESRPPSPIETAQREYIRLNGNQAFSNAIRSMLNHTLS